MASENNSEIGNERLDVEKKRVEIEQQRLEIERTRSEREQRFFNKNFAVILTAAVTVVGTLLTVLGAGAQVWTTYISKDKEIEIASMQKQAENQRLEKEKEREYSLSTAKFVMENNKTLFSGTPNELKRMAMIIGLLFPREIADRMYEDLRTTADSDEAKRIWSRARETIKGRLSDRGPTPPNPGDASSNGERKNSSILSGTVFDNSTSPGKPVEGANVTVIDATNNVVFKGATDSSGVFVTPPLPPGTYEIQTAHDSYISWPAKTILRPNVDASLTLPLKRKENVP
jgi:hypothetical protein